MWKGEEKCVIVGERVLSSLFRQWKDNYSPEPPNYERKSSLSSSSSSSVSSTPSSSSPSSSSSIPTPHPLNELLKGELSVDLDDVGEDGSGADEGVHDEDDTSPPSLRPSVASLERNGKAGQREESEEDEKEEGSFARPHSLHRGLQYPADEMRDPSSENGIHTTEQSPPGDLHPNDFYELLERTSFVSANQSPLRVKSKFSYKFGDDVGPRSPSASPSPATHPFDDLATSTNSTDEKGEELREKDNVSRKKEGSPSSAILTYDAPLYLFPSSTILSVTEINPLTQAGLTRLRFVLPLLLLPVCFH